MPATLQSRLPEIAAKVRPRVSKAVKEGAEEEIAVRARDRVPVRTGALRDAIEVRRAGAVQVRVVAGDSGAFYGHFLEFGTATMDAHPFVLPAADEGMAPLTERVVVVLQEL